MASEVAGQTIYKLDQIHIRDLQVRCIVGVYSEERREKQDLVINITLHANLRDACLTDNLEATIDYKAIKKNVVAMVENSSYQLIEALAENVARLCLAEPKVQWVEVTVDKPGALRFARSAAVQIMRGREEYG